MNFKMLPADLFVTTPQKGSMQTAPDGMKKIESLARPQKSGAAAKPAHPAPPVPQAASIPKAPPVPAAPPVPKVPPAPQATSAPKAPPVPAAHRPARLAQTIIRQKTYAASARAAATRAATRTAPTRPASAHAAQPGTGPVFLPRARYYLCTVTDIGYLFKVLAQYRSLENTGSDFHIFICCTDHASYRVLTALRLQRCTPLALSQLNDGELFTLQRERKANEFSWTLKSYLMMFLIRDCGAPHVLYCDGDVGFWSDLSVLYADWGDSAIYLCTQRDVDWVERKYGKYQAGILGIRNTDAGIRMLHWWKQKCREWCFAYEDNGRLGDQKYLDDVPPLFGDVKISWNKGINAAPWNTVYNNGYAVTAANGRVTIDGDPLVAYHYACIDIYDERRFDLWSLGSISIQPVVRRSVYVPYLKLLQEAIALVRAYVTDIKPLFKQKSFEDAKTPFILSDNNLRMLGWNGEYAFCTVCSRTYVARTLALYSSIRRHLNSFHLWICCADDTAYAILSRFAPENTTLLTAKDVETPEIRATRPSKTVAEYCWTLKPALCSHVFAHYNVTRLLYCDSDIYFFSHPRPIHELWNNYTTLLSRQLGPAELENRFGMFQAGVIGFTKEAESLKILRWWQKKCTEWCYDDHSDPERWGDQKYLQKIPDLFSSIRINSRYGQVAAPWNIVMNNRENLQVSRAGSDVYLGGEKLVAYHFGSINMLSARTFDLWKHEPLTFDQRVLTHIYTPYLKHLSAICREIAAKGFNTAMLFDDGHDVKNPFTLHREADDGRALLAGW